MRLDNNHRPLCWISNAPIVSSSLRQQQHHHHQHQVNTLRTNQFLTSTKSVHRRPRSPFPNSSHLNTATTRKVNISCTATPQEQHEQDPQGINETAIFYAALVAAQLLPFSNATSGLAGDIAYFSITALSCIVIGVRRAGSEPEALSAPLSKTQALAAPFTASAFLFGSYLLLKYTNVDLNLILNGLTTLGGSLCLKETLDPIFHSLLKVLNITNFEILPEKKVSLTEDEKGNKTKKEINLEEQLKSSTSFMLSNGLSTISTIALITCYLLKVEPTFVFSNIIAVGLATRVLSLIKPSSFFVASALLIGLFFYDIYWVFGTEVMISVATNIDTPGKLLFPRVASASSTINYPYAILGLGDVCVPGVFVSIAQSLDMKFASNVPKEKQPYFITSMVAYITALFTCFWANFQTEAAQPALLYFVPALIGSNLLVAAVRGELKEVLFFSTEEEDEEDEADKENDNKDDTE